MILSAIKNVLNLVGLESGNVAGTVVNGYKRKEGFIDSNDNGPNSIGNDFYARTNFSQGALLPTEHQTDLAIQGRGFFVLFDDTFKASIDPTKKLSDLNTANRFDTPITSGNFTVNGQNVSVNVSTDSLNDVLNKIAAATATVPFPGGEVTGVYDDVHNSVTLTNNTGIPGSPIVFGGGATTNFLDAMKLTNAAIQPGASNLNFKESTGPVGIPESERKLYFSRKGNFFFNNDGFLTNDKGMFVASMDSKGNLIKTDKRTYDGLGNIDDKIHFSANGILFNDTQLSKEGKQLALGTFPNLGGLQSSSKGGEIYEATESAGRMKIDYPDKNQMGLLRDQNLEASNANTVDSLANLGILQRFFPSTLAAIKVTLSAQDDLNNTIK